MRRIAAGALPVLALTLLAAAARADPPAARKVAFIGCLAKPEDAALGAQVSEALERGLDRDRLAGFEFLSGAVAAAKARLKGGPVNAPRIVEAGRALGADEVLVCMLVYQRQRAAEVPETTKTVTVTRQETEYVEEEYYEEVPNPDYEEPTSLAVPVGRAGPVNFSIILKSKAQPKTIREKHVRRVPKKRLVSEEVSEPDAPASEKPGFVRLRAAYVVLDVASGKPTKRDAVSYYNEIEPVFDAIETDEDLRRKAAESTADSLERSILEALSGKLSEPRAPVAGGPGAGRRR